MKVKKQQKAEQKKHQKTASAAAGSTSDGNDPFARKNVGGEESKVASGSSRPTTGGR